MELVSSVIISGNVALAQRFCSLCPNVSSDWDNDKVASSSSSSSWGGDVDVDVGDDSCDGGGGDGSDGHYNSNSIYNNNNNSSSSNNGNGNGNAEFMSPPYALERLCLSSVKLVDSNLVKFSCFTNLSHLNLSFNKLTNINPIVTLTNLRFLDISHNKIDSLEPLRTNQRVGYMTSLRFCHNHITTIEPISSFTSLRELCFAHNEIDWCDMLYLHSLTSLDKLLKTDNPCNKKPRINDLIAALAHSLQMIDGESLTDKFNNMNERLDFLKSADGRVMFTQAKAIISSTHTGDISLNGSGRGGPLQFLSNNTNSMNMRGAVVGGRSVSNKLHDASQALAYLPLPHSTNSVYRDAIGGGALGGGKEHVNNNNAFSDGQGIANGGKKSSVSAKPPPVQKFRVAHQRPTPHFTNPDGSQTDNLGARDRDIPMIAPERLDFSIMGSHVADNNSKHQLGKPLLPVSNYNNNRLNQKGGHSKAQSTTSGSSSSSTAGDAGRGVDVPDSEVGDKIVMYFGVPTIAAAAANGDPSLRDELHNAHSNQPIALSLSSSGEGYVRWSKLGAIACSFEKNRLFCSHKSGSIAAIVDGNGSGSILDPRGRSVFVMNEQGTARVLDKQGHILASYSRNNCSVSSSSAVSSANYPLPGLNINNISPPSPGSTMAISALSHHTTAVVPASQSWTFDGIQLEFVPSTWDLIIKLQNERVSVQFSSVSGGKIIKDREVKLKKTVGAKLNNNNNNNNNNPHYYVQNAKQQRAGFGGGGRVGGKAANEKLKRDVRNDLLRQDVVVVPARNDGSNAYYDENDDYTDDDHDGQHHEPIVLSARGRGAGVGGGRIDAVNNEVVNQAYSHHQHVRSKAHDIISNLDDLLSQMGTKR